MLSAARRRNKHPIHSRDDPSMIYTPPAKAVPLGGGGPGLPPSGNEELLRIRDHRALPPAGHHPGAVL